MLLTWALVVASSLGAAERVCPTVSSGHFGALETSPSFLFFAPEERRSLGAGSKLVRVRGDVPEPGADVLARTVEDGYRLTVEELGFPVFPDRVSVSFSDGLTGDRGVTRLAADGRAADIVLSRSLRGDALVMELRHQVGHLVEAGFSVIGPDWWREASASWLAGNLGRERALSSSDLGQRFADLDRSPASAASSTAATASILWFLDARFGGESVRRVWEELGAAGGEPLVALMRVLDARGEKLDETIEGYSAWLVAEARRRGVASTTRPAAEFVLEPASLPIHETISARAPEPWGMALLRFDASEIIGGLHLELQAQPGAPWVASALLVPYGSDIPNSRVTLARFPDGRAEVTIPTSDVAEVILVVANLGQPGRLLFSVAATTDGAFPFVLEDVRATPTAEGVRVSWDTAREEDVFGWRVLRTEADGEAFRPLGQILAPSVSLGQGQGGGEYRFVDTAVEAGRVYYYMVQAITSVGLLGSTHVVSASVR